MSNPSEEPAEAVKIEITINGDRRTVEPGTSVAALIESLGLRSDRVALDRALLRRALHGRTLLVGGEVIEVVTLVGGG